MGFKKILPIVMITLVILLGTQFLIYQLGSVESHSNVTGEYQEQLNSSRDSSIVSLSIMKLIPMVLGAVILIIAISYIMKRR